MEGLSSLSPLLGGLLSLFGGGGQTLAAPTPFMLPAPVQSQAGLTASAPGQVAPVSYGETGQPRAQSASASPQVTIQVNAMDSQSFLDHSDDIAMAVKQAILNSNSLNDVISDLVDMSTFPTLKTGAVMQYPAQRGVAVLDNGFAIRGRVRTAFPQLPGAASPVGGPAELAGSKRTAGIPGILPRHSWTEPENFAFTDPWDGTNYPSCSLASDSITAVLAGEWNGETSLTVMENGS